MKKPMSIRKKYRKRNLRMKAAKKKIVKRFEKTDFFQWSPTTINGVKQ